MREWPRTFGEVKIYDAEFMVTWSMLLEQGFNFDVWDANTAVLEWRRLIRDKIDGSYSPRDGKKWYQWELRATAPTTYSLFFRYHYGWVRQGDTEVLFMELQADLDGHKSSWVEPWTRSDYSLWADGRRVAGYPPWSKWFDCERRVFQPFTKTYEQVLLELAAKKAAAQALPPLPTSTS